MVVGSTKFQTMKEIRVTRAFLKKPIPNSLILLSIVILLHAVGWLMDYKFKLEFIQKAGGIFNYILVIIISNFFPELVTLLITFSALECYHNLQKITTISNDWRAIIRYELQFLPIFLVAFPFYNVFTQTFRYFIENLPFLWFSKAYSWQHYWQGYILKTYTWKFYQLYTLSVTLLGYLSINISLLQDYLRQRRECARQEAIEQLQEGILPTVQPLSPLGQPYLSSLKGKNAQGELTFAVNDVYFFTIQERTYYAQLDKGQYIITKTLNELAAELAPEHFFRLKRDYIVNRLAILDYSHWENGKYIVRLNTPTLQQVVIPRLRMQELREWLNAP